MLYLVRKIRTHSELIVEPIIESKPVLEKYVFKINMQDGLPVLLFGKSKREDAITKKDIKTLHSMFT